MKTLSIIRHGKAEKANGNIADQLRPLAKRGFKESRLAARFLLQLNDPAQLIIASPARRARETAKTVGDTLNSKIPIVIEEAIYEASAQNLANVLRRLPESTAHAILVGHNPGLEELVSGLCAGSYNRLNLQMRTGMVAYIGLEIFHWQQVRWGCGQLQQLISPNLVSRPKKKKK